MDLPAAAQRLADRVAAVDDRVRGHDPRAAHDRRGGARRSRRRAAPAALRTPGRAPVPAGRLAPPSPSRAARRAGGRPRPSPSPPAPAPRRSASSTASARRALLLREQRLEPQHAEHLAQVAVAGPLGQLVRRPDPLVQRRQRLAVLKSSASASKNASRCTASSSGESPAASRRPASRIRRAALPAASSDSGVNDERLPVVAGGEVQDQRLAADLVEHLGQPADVADRLGHLLALGRPRACRCASTSAPAACPRPATVWAISFSWCGKTRSMPPPWMSNSEPQQLLGHRRALDVPARPAAPPRRVPRRVLALLVRLPEREVERVLFQVGAFDALALVHLVDVAARQRAVLGQRAHAEVDVAAGRVGVPALDQRADQVEDRLHVLGGERLVVGPAEAEPLGVGHVVGGHLARQVGRLAPGRPRGVVDLVVDVGDVGHERHAVALVLEEALQLREDHERPRVADVHARVDGRPAGVDADRARVARLEGPQLPRARVVEPDRPHRGVTLPRWSHRRLALGARRPRRQHAGPAVACS